MYEEANQLIVNILYYKYEYAMKGESYNLIYYGTKDNESFKNPEDLFVESHVEHFKKYKFVFVPSNNTYVFDYVELAE